VSRARLIADLIRRPRECRYGEHPAQRADLHLPDGPGPHPVVVTIHGGSWHATYGKIVMRPLAADLARRGYAAWNIEYRRIGRGQGGGWPATFRDVAAAVDQLASLDAHLDLTRVTAVGHSAGGQLALWAAGRYTLAPGAPGAGPRVRIAAAVAQAGVVDLTGAYAAAPHGSVAALMGGSPQRFKDRYDVADPIRHVPLDLPVLLVHGREDATVSIKRSRAYALAARAAGGTVELVELADGDGGHRAHIDPRAAGWGVVTAWLARLTSR
jgi:acetyl esterase/lipase